MYSLEMLIWPATFKIAKRRNCVRVLVGLSQGEHSPSGCGRGVPHRDGSKGRSPSPSEKGLPKPSIERLTLHFGLLVRAEFGQALPQIAVVDGEYLGCKQGCVFGAVDGHCCNRHSLWHLNNRQK